MPGKKSLTIGITVNLENYENLRLEVTGEVTDQREVQELAGFLDQTLTTFGRGNPATVALIDKFRARVLSPGEGAAPAVPASKPPVYPHEEEPEWPDMEVSAPEQQPQTPSAEEVPAQKSEKPKKIEKTPEPVTPPEPAPVPETPHQAPPAMPKPAPAEAPVVTPAAEPASPPPAAASGAVCEICGCAVSSSEQKMSQLFMSRTLCKACMKNA